MREKLNRGDWIFLALCGAVFVVGLAIGIQYFDDAFPEAAIDFKFNRAASGQIAEKFLAQMGLAFADYRHASEFRHDDTAKIFLERTVGLQKVNELTRGEVRIWAWRHRWFKPLQIEEVRVDIAPTGEVVSFFHKVPEDRAAPALDHDTEESQAEGFLRSVGVAPEKLELVSRSEKVLPKRTDVTYVWESQTVKPGGAPYRYTVEFHGNRIGAFSQSVKVPDQWIRDYQKLRSKNIAAGAVDEVFLALTIIGALIIFIVRLRRGDLHLRFSLGAGLIGALLIILVSLNEFPSAMANYDTSTSFAAFIAQQILFPILQGLVGGILLAVIVGSGEVMYRQRFPRHLAMPLVVSRRSLTSKRVFKGFILGYALFAAFLAYQVIFYIVASRYGAWSPAEIPYTSILNSAFPWAAVLFMGFFPAVSEEFLSRAFSIPFFERFLRSKYAAIILAGFVWGFGHAAYPNQPFYIRGVEVGIAGVVMGLLMYRFGLIGLLVWHYTVDALYTSFLLFRSGNPYYIFSAGLASLIFVIPTFVAIAMYMRNRGFIPDDDLNNSVLGVATVVPEPEEERPAELAPTVAAPVTRVAVVTMIVLVALAAAAIAFSGPALDDVIDYRITKAEATAIARRHLAAIKVLAVPPRVIPIPVDGFRAWNPDSRREDGGAPTGYDLAAVQYLLDHAPSPVRRILGAQRNEIEAATWMTRFFEPGKKEEIFVEVDPRTSLPIGYHRYRDEEAPGPSLEQSAAEPIARAEMTRYGLKADDFELKEALNFQQPKRRDWLFHYQEKKPLADEATRRATVRVMGNEVTQFAKTVKIPERDRREFEKETVVNTIITVLRIAAIVTLFGLVIYGVVAAARGHRFAWKPALRWALMLAPLPILAVFLQREVFLSQYDTSTPWETFTIVMFVATGFLIAFQIGVVWLSIAILETIIPGARRLLGSEGARRYGAAAVVAALSAVAMSALSGTLLQHLVTWFPRHAPVDGLGPPMVVAIPLPAIGILWQAILAALALSAAVAGFVGALRATPPNRRKVIHAIAITCLLLIGMDSSVQRHQMPLMILTAIVGVVVVYAIVAWILRDNLIAYPLAVFVMSLASAAVGLLQNHRADLQINAYILIAIALAALAFYALIPLRHQTTRGRGDAETRRHGDTGM